MGSLSTIKKEVSLDQFAPPYSNLFMTGLKKRIFQNSDFKPFLWLRYLDEIFGLSTQDSKKIKRAF